MMKSKIETGLQYVEHGVERSNCRTSTFAGQLRSTVNELEAVMNFRGNTDKLSMRLSSLFIIQQQPTGLANLCISSKTGDDSAHQFR